METPISKLLEGIVASVESLKKEMLTQPSDYNGREYFGHNGFGVQKVRLSPEEQLKGDYYDKDGNHYFININLKKMPPAGDDE